MLLIFRHTLKYYVLKFHCRRHFSLRTALFWVITQRVVAISHQRFGTTYRSHVHLSMGPRGCPETPARNCHYSLRNYPEERSSHLLCGGSLISLFTPVYCFLMQFITKTKKKQNFNAIVGNSVARYFFHI
jgi:hypothetical protein